MWKTQKKSRPIWRRYKVAHGISRFITNISHRAMCMSLFRESANGVYYVAYYVKTLRSSVGVAWPTLCWLNRERKKKKSTQLFKKGNVKMKKRFLFPFQKKKEENELENKFKSRTEEPPLVKRIKIEERIDGENHLCRTTQQQQFPLNPIFFLSSQIGGLSFLFIAPLSFSDTHLHYSLSTTYYITPDRRRLRNNKNPGTRYLLPSF